MKKGLIALLTTLVLAGAVYAQVDSVEVSQSIDVHQGWPRANDIHFVVYPNEPWVGILAWQMNIYGAPPYSYTVDSVYNDEGKLHWLRFDVTFDAVIPYCTTITIDVKLWLDQLNAIIIDSIYWTWNGQKINEETKFDFPGQGFSVDNISPDGLSTVWIRNQSDEVLVVKNVRFARNQPSSISPSELDQFDGWTDQIGSITVLPLSSYAVPLEGMQAGAFLYLAWDVFEPGAGVGADVFQGPSFGVHEDQLGAVPLNVKEYGVLDEVKFLDVNAYPGYSSIHYFLPKAANVNLSVYAVSGELVATLVNEEQSAGGHTLRWEGNGLPSGLYIARLSADGIQASEKMIRLK